MSSLSRNAITDPLAELIATFLALAAPLLSDEITLIRFSKRLNRQV
jgi:hypothetical protein